MAITNLPYDDERIVAALDSGAGVRSETRDVRVDFAGMGTTEDDVATVTATVSWTVSAAEAVRILEDARILVDEHRTGPAPTEQGEPAACEDGAAPTAA